MAKRRRPSLTLATRASTNGLRPRGPSGYVAMRPGKRRQLDLKRESGRLLNEVERLKACVRAKVEHPFRVLKQQFGFTKVRYRGLKKNTAQIFTLFALSNLWMARRQLMEASA